MIRAGELNRTAQLLRETPAGTDELGQPVTTLTPVLLFRVALEYRSEDEPFEVSQRSEFRAVTFRSRFIDDIRMTDVIECEGKRYDIKGWREIGLRVGLEIAAEHRQ